MCVRENMPGKLNLMPYFYGHTAPWYDDRRLLLPVLVVQRILVELLDDMDNVPFLEPFMPNDP